MRLGERIAQSRNDKGLSQEELAHKSAISIRTIQRIEKGSVIPHGHTLRSLAKTLDLDFDQLITREGTNAKTKQLRLLNSMGLLVIILPLIHLVFQFLFWSRHKKDSDFDHNGRKIISLQVLWALIVFVTLGLIHLASLLISGQKVVGHYPVRITAYLTLLIVNVLLTLTNSIKIGQKDYSFLEKIPSII